MPEYARIDVADVSHGDIVYRRLPNLNAPINGTSLLGTATDMGGPFHTTFYRHLVQERQRGRVLVPQQPTPSAFARLQRQLEPGAEIPLGNIDVENLFVLRS